MGIAAYNRGSEVIGRQIRAAHDPHSNMSNFDRSLAILLEDANRLPAGKVELFQDTVARYHNVDGWTLMNRPDDGWGEYGVPMDLRTIRKTYRVQLLGFGRDEHSLFVNVICEKRT